MIPRAIEMIFKETQALKELGWQYAMTGQFVEIYNERVRRATADVEIDVSGFNADILTRLKTDQRPVW